MIPSGIFIELVKVFHLFSVRLIPGINKHYINQYICVVIEITPQDKSEVQCNFSEYILILELKIYKKKLINFAG